jgi:hypothetical protein
VIAGSYQSDKGLYYVRKGQVYVILFNGTLGHMADLTEGDYFGEHNLHHIGLSGGARVFTMIILAATDCELLLLKTSAYEDCCRLFPKSVTQKLSLNYRKVNSMMRGTLNG